jgi:L-ascorbate metabolism protein UlaG (beta-lactamase superfamily)
MSEKLQSYARQIADTRPPAGAIGIFWIGQAGFILRGKRTTLAIDAYLSARDTRRFDAPAAASELGFVDAFLATHEHRDHLDLPQWPAFAAAAPRARFIVPAPIVDRAAEAVGDGRVTGAAPDVVIAIGDARITPLPACHGVHVADAYSFGLTAGEHRYLGYVVELDGVRLFHAGDTIRYDGMAERLRALDVEVALLPINGRSAEREAQELVGNLSAQEAADLAADAGVRAVIPMHYELFAHNSGRAADLVDRATAAHPELAVHILPCYGGMLYSARR